MFHRREVPPPPAVPRDEAYLASARRESTDALVEAIHQGREVRRMSEDLKGRRIRNGFPELIENAMSKRPKGGGLF